MVSSSSCHLSACRLTWHYGRMTQQGGSPTVRRRRLGLQLRAHRERCNLTIEQVAASLETGARSVLRWELAQANIRTSDLRALLDLYAVSADQRTELETLAREGRQPGWWTPYTSAVRPTFATFLGLEAEAASHMEYSAMVIPGLLQTPRYMRAVMTAAIPRLGDDTIEKRIEVRQKRQAEMLGRAYPTHFVIDEACLHRSIGDHEVMAEQLAHIMESAKSRLITIQVVPFAAGAHASTLGSFSVLTFVDMPPVACVEMLGGDLYADGPDSALYTEHFVSLREAALPQPLAMSLVDKIRKEVHHAL